MLYVLSSFKVEDRQDANPYCFDAEAKSLRLSAFSWTKDLKAMTLPSSLMCLRPPPPSSVRTRVASLLKLSTCARANPGKSGMLISICSIWNVA